MHLFFIERTQLDNDIIEISGNDHNHMKNVLRMRVGEKVLLSAGDDKEYEACIVDYKDDKTGQAAMLKITDIFGSSRELPAKITLFQGYPKGDKMEQIVQKAVELGVYEIVPVMMNRCVVKLDEKKAEKKVERLNAVSESAAKQCKRGIIPKVSGIMTFEQSLSLAKNLEYVIIPYECAEGMSYSREIISEALKHESIGIYIGPEGGLEASEISLVESIDGKVISLGHRILRTETAGIALLSVLMYMLDN